MNFLLQRTNTNLVGFAGCNRMFGRYALDGASLKFDGLGGTRMFCQANMDLEQKFLAMFQNVTGWRIRDPRCNCWMPTPGPSPHSVRHESVRRLCCCQWLLGACSEPKPEAVAMPEQRTNRRPDHASDARKMRGMYSYMADAGWYTDCLSGARMPVAQEGDNAALEAAYSKAKQMRGAPLLAVVEGRVEDRVPMEGNAKRPTLIVEKFISVDAQGCSGPQTTAQLENTYWALMTLHGASMESPKGAREIHFVLHSEGRRVAGFSGCNQMTGSYQLTDAKITFSQMGGTMMACVNGMEQEQNFHQLFARVARWKIAGETLQLLDGAGTVLATFESRYMK